jgi:uncharacterized protein YegL
LSHPESQYLPTQSVMPGGGVARRPLHVILIADCSGSMTGPKIKALNFAIGDMIQHFASWEREQEKRILIRAVAFANEPRWHIPEPVPAADMTWTDLEAVNKGYTFMAPAFRMVARALADGQASRGLRPVLVLVTDGQPTDQAADFEAGLRELLAVPAARDAMRIAVAGADQVHRQLKPSCPGGERCRADRRSAVPCLVVGHRSRSQIGQPGSAGSDAATGHPRHLRRGAVTHVR